MYHVTTVRPVSVSGWYATTCGRASYWQSSFGHRAWKPGMSDMICTELRYPWEITHLVADSSNLL